MHTDYYMKEVEAGQERDLRTRGPLLNNRSLLNIGGLEVGLEHYFREI